MIAVSETTLRERLKGRKPRSETRANNPILSSIQEVLIQLSKLISSTQHESYPQHLWNLDHVILSPRLTYGYLDHCKRLHHC